MPSVPETKSPVHSGECNPHVHVAFSSYRFFCPVCRLGCVLQLVDLQWLIEPRTHNFRLQRSFFLCRPVYRASPIPVATFTGILRHYINHKHSVMTPEGVLGVPGTVIVWEGLGAGRAITPQIGRTSNPSTTVNLEEERLDLANAITANFQIVQENIRFWRVVPRKTRI